MIGSLLNSGVKVIHILAEVFGKGQTWERKDSVMPKTKWCTLVPGLYVMKPVLLEKQMWSGKWLCNVPHFMLCLNQFKFLLDRLSSCGHPVVNYIAAIGIIQCEIILLFPNRFIWYDIDHFVVTCKVPSFCKTWEVLPEGWLFIDPFLIFHSHKYLKGYPYSSTSMNKTTSGTSNNHYQGHSPEFHFSVFSIDVPLVKHIADQNKKVYK